MTEAEDSSADQTTSAPLADYDVGYGKPPRRSQFKKGKSGNPNGRPRARTDLSALVSEALDERIRTTSGGVEKNVSKTKAMLTALVNKTLKGDQKAMRMLTKLAARTRNLEPIPDYRAHVGVIRMSYDEHKEYKEHPERQPELIARAEERAFKERADRLEKERRQRMTRGHTNT
jgi:hypothetical protein